jgi:hypothetical protein
MIISAVLSRLRNVVLASAASAAVTAHAQDWNSLNPATFPMPRSYFAMAYDGASHQIVLFGGVGPKGYHHDTWLFNGERWTKLSTPTAPSGRAGTQMAYDELTQQVVLFGGYDGTNWLGDTWIWDGTTHTWTEAHPAHSPPRATSPMLFTDPRGHADKFGGFDGNTGRYDLTFWRWQGSDWKRIAPHATVPYARSSASAALNPVINQVVLFGGLADVNPDNTWTYENGAWTLQQVNRQPPLEFGAPAAFDGTNSVIIFGGFNAGQESTWAWTGSRWKHVLAAHTPPPREGAGMAYFPELGRAVLFGGVRGDTYFNDTWEFVP